MFLQIKFYMLFFLVCEYLTFTDSNALNTATALVELFLCS